jgi:hypothetical protein
LATAFHCILHQKFSLYLCTLSSFNQSLLSLYLSLSLSIVLPFSSLSFRLSIPNALSLSQMLSLFLFICLSLTLSVALFLSVFISLSLFNYLSLYPHSFLIVHISFSPWHTFSPFAWYPRAVDRISSNLRESAATYAHVEYCSGTLPITELEAGWPDELVKNRPKYNPIHCLVKFYV